MDTKTTALISPIADKIHVAGHKPVVIYGQGGMPVRFHSIIKAEDVVLTDEGWLKYNVDNFESRYNNEKAYTQYARNFQNLSEQKKQQAIEATAIPPAPKVDENGMPVFEKMVTPIVISHRHVRAMMEEFHTKEQEILKSKNFAEAKNTSASFNKARAENIIKDRDRTISRIKNNDATNAFNAESDATNTSKSKSTPRIEPAKTVEVRDISAEEEKTLVSNTPLIEQLRSLFRFSKDKPGSDNTLNM